MQEARIIRIIITGINKWSNEMETKIYDHWDYELEALLRVANDLYEDVNYSYVYLDRRKHGEPVRKLVSQEEIDKSKVHLGLYFRD